MTPTTGYYCLIQFCPDPSRLEAANIGVLLFAPGRHFLKAVTAHNNRRIQQFFGREGFDWDRMTSFKLGIEERVQAELGTIHTLADLEQFIARRANRIVLSPPRPMRVGDPDQDLLQLFHDLIGGKPRTKKDQSLKAYLGTRFNDAGLLSKVRTDIRVLVPTFERKVEIPYGYQNGRFNLIQPARFRATDERQVMTSACWYAVEGESLFDHPDPELGDLQLVVVGEFSNKPSASRATVRKILNDHSVKLYESTNLDELLADIRDNAKVSI